MYKYVLDRFAVIVWVLISATVVSCGSVGDITSSENSEVDYVRGAKQQPKPLLLNEKDKYLYAIEQANLVGAPNSIKDCVSSKFSFKDVCLGVTLAEFTNFRKLALIEPKTFLKNPDVYRAAKINAMGDAWGACRYHNITFDEVARFQWVPSSFQTPLGFTNIICDEDNTLLGLGVSVKYEFINERLVSIKVNGNSRDQNSIKSINFILDPLKQKLQEPTETNLKTNRDRLYSMTWLGDNAKSSFKISWRSIRETSQDEVSSWDIEITKPEVGALYKSAVAQSIVDTQNSIDSKFKKDF